MYVFEYINTEFLLLPYSRFAVYVLYTIGELYIEGFLNLVLLKSIRIAILRICNQQGSAGAEYLELQFC